MSDEEEFYSEEEEEQETSHSSDINLEAFFPSHEAYTKHQEFIENDKKYLIDHFEAVSWKFNKPEDVNKLNAKEARELVRDLKHQVIMESAWQCLEMDPEEYRKSCLEDELYIKRLADKIEKRYEDINQRLVDKIEKRYEDMKTHKNVMPKLVQNISRNVPKVSNILERTGLDSTSAIIGSCFLGLLAMDKRLHETDEDTSEESTSE